MSAEEDVWAPLRKAGASARAMLVTAAAERWSVAPTTCTAANAMVTHAETGRTLAAHDAGHVNARQQALGGRALPHRRDIGNAGRMAIGAAPLEPHECEPPPQAGGRRRAFAQ